MREHLLGFDARELWLPPDALWDDARRRRFLLRADTPKPLSVDATVWPSVFRAGDGDGYVGRLLRRHGVFVVPVPAWIGPTGTLWEDLARMRSHLGANWARPRPTAIIAVSWIADPEENGLAEPDLPATTPAEPDPDWELLGYDVADRWLLSGLANCGYGADDVDEFRSRWSPALNAHHLFAEVAAARAFRGATDARVPEHAPFRVYAVRLVASDSPI